MADCALPLTANTTHRTIHRFPADRALHKSSSAGMSLLQSLALVRGEATNATSSSSSMGGSATERPLSVDPGALRPCTLLYY